MRKLIIGWLLVIGIVSVGRACEHCAALAVGNVVPAKVKYFGLKDVRLLDSPFKNAMDRNAAWMLEMDMDRLLSNFLKNAGLEPKGESYGSWESMGIAGHTLGHYLSAVAQQYASTGDERFKQRVDYIVHELDSCQQYFVNGFIGGMPGGDRVFKQVKKGIIRSAGFDLNGLWVPWYNEHKTMMGLNDAYLLAGNETAKKVLVNLADYLVDVLAGLTDEQVQTMLNCEFGGMNEAFAQVYALTGNKKYLDASYRFYHRRLMEPLAEGKDILPGLHSNTQIPKIIGSARQYELTGNSKDERIAEFFCKIRQHCFHSLRSCLRGSRIIQINQFFHVICPPVLVFTSCPVQCHAAFLPALLYQLSETNLIHSLIDTVIDPLPDILRDTAVRNLTVSIRSEAGTLYRIQTAFKSPEHIAHRYMIHVLRQHISSARASDALDQLRFLQERHQLFKVAFRNILPLGNTRCRYRSFPAVPGQIDQGPQAISSFRGKFQYLTFSV